MNAYRRIANANHEHLGRATTHSTSRHGPGRVMQKCKRRINRAAKRLEARRDLQEQCNTG